MSDNGQPRFWSDLPPDAQERGFARPPQDAPRAQPPQSPPQGSGQQRQVPRPPYSAPQQQTPPQNPQPYPPQSQQGVARPKYRPQRPNPSSSAARYQQFQSQQRWSNPAPDAAPQQPQERQRLVGHTTWWVMLVITVVMLGFASVWVIPQRSTAIFPHLAVLYVAFAIYLVVQWLIPGREWMRYLLALSIPLLSFLLMLAIQNYGVLWFAFGVGGVIGATFGWFTAEAFKPIPEKNDPRRGH